MKSFLKTFLCVAIWSLTFARAETVWVTGVSQEGGWYDANKTIENDGDENLCWAASASNLLAWWQAQYQLPANIPNSIDAIWSKYKDSATIDEGGDTHAAIQWWLTGVYLPTSSDTNDEQYERSLFEPNETYTSTLSAFEGYYYELCNLKMDEVFEFICPEYRPAYTPEYLSNVGRNLIELVGQGCGVGLSVTNDTQDDDPMVHAITLWGIEYEGDAISGLWLTDSDDNQYGYHADGLFSVAVEQIDGKMYISTTESAWYTAEDKVYIDGILAINPAVSNGWGLALIPEPTTTTLSLLALAGLAARRRRL